MAKITMSHASNTAALNNITLEREQVNQREAEMRQMVEKAEEKRAWFDSFREWVESVASFLDEKESQVLMFSSAFVHMLCSIQFWRNSRKNNYPFCKSDATLSNKDGWRKMTTTFPVFLADYHYP
jgi:hypothetical protein